MIDLETTQEGFAISVGGQGLLAHSRRNPCVEIGRSEGAIRLAHGSGLPRRRRQSVVPLRGFKVAEREPEFLSIDFDGRIRMSLRMKEGRLRVSFSRYDASINHFSLRLSAWPDEHIYGCGERTERLDLKGLAVPLWVRGSGATLSSAHRSEDGRRVTQTQTQLYAQHATLHAGITTDCELSKKRVDDDII